MNQVGLKKMLTMRSGRRQVCRRVKVPAIVLMTSERSFSRPGIEFSGGLPDNANYLGQSGMKTFIIL